MVDLFGVHFALIAPGDRTTALTMGLFSDLAFGTTTSSRNVGRWTVFVRLVPIIVEKHTFIPRATVVTCKQQNDRCKETSSKTKLLGCRRDFGAAPQTIHFFKACHEQLLLVKLSVVFFCA